jgi:hypothetical protein
MIWIVLLLSAIISVGVLEIRQKFLDAKNGKKEE